MIKALFATSVFFLFILFGTLVTIIGFQADVLLGTVLYLIFVFSAVFISIGVFDWGYRE